MSVLTVTPTFPGPLPSPSHVPTSPRQLWLTVRNQNRPRERQPLPAPTVWARPGQDGHGRCLLAGSLLLPLPSWARDVWWNAGSPPHRPLSQRPEKSSWPPASPDPSLLAQPSVAQGPRATWADAPPPPASLREYPVSRMALRPPPSQHSGQTLPTSQGTQPSRLAVLAGLPGSPSPRREPVTPRPPRTHTTALPHQAPSHLPGLGARPSSAVSSPP